MTSAVRQVAFGLAALVLLGGCALGRDDGTTEADALEVHGVAQGLFVDVRFPAEPSDGAGTGDQPEDEPEEEPAPDDDGDGGDEEPEHEPGSDEDPDEPGLRDPEGDDDGGPGALVRADLPRRPPRQTASNPTPSNRVPGRYGPEPEVRVAGTEDDEAGDERDDVAVEVAVGTWPSAEHLQVDASADVSPSGGVEVQAEGQVVDLSGVRAAEVRATCTADATGAAGSVLLDGLEVLGTAVDERAPAPNTVLTSEQVPALADDVTITLNRQREVAIGQIAALEVVAIHIDAGDDEGDGPRPSDADGEMWLGRAVCGAR